MAWCKESIKTFIDYIWYGPVAFLSSINKKKSHTCKVGGGAKPPYLLKTWFFYGRTKLQFSQRHKPISPITI